MSPLYLLRRDSREIVYIGGVSHIVQKCSEVCLIVSWHYCIDFGGEVIRKYIT